MKKWTTSLRRLIFLAATAAKGILKTVTGNPIHILDALAKPAQALSIALEPIQDLNGYDNPWSAGGGVNLLPPYSLPSVTDQGVTLTNNNGEYTLNGMAVSNTAVFDINVSLPAGQYTVALNNPTANSKVQIYGIDENVAVPLQVLCSTANTTATATFAATVKKFRIRVLANGTVDNFKLSPVFSAGATAATKFYPYSNICPISGHTDADVTRTGKNLLDPNYRSNLTANIRFYYNTTGFLLKANTAYTFSVSSPSAQNSIHEIGGSQLTANYGKTSITYTPTQDVYVWLDAYYAGNYPVPSGGTAAVNCQLELGSTATDYEEYRGTTYPIPLGQTVYGGTLDVVTGVLTVTHGIYTFSENDVWTSYNTGGKVTFNSGSRFPPNIDTTKDGIMSNYPFYEASYIGGQMNKSFCFFSSPYLSVCDDAFSDATAFATSMVGQQLVYPLATPQIIQLTPTQVELLLGENNIWSDGEMTLTYLADGNASDAEALNILLGGRYTNTHGEDEPTDREALDILLGGTR